MNTKYYVSFEQKIIFSLFVKCNINQILRRVFLIFILTKIKSLESACFCYKSVTLKNMSKAEVSLVVRYFPRDLLKTQRLRKKNEIAAFMSRNTANK